MDIDRDIHQLEEKLRLKRIAWRNAEGAYRTFLEAGGKLLAKDLERLKREKQTKENL